MWRRNMKRRCAPFRCARGQMRSYRTFPPVGPINDPSAVIPPAGCTILQRSRCPHGEGSTSGTKPPPFATPSVSIPPWFSCRDTVGKSARLRVGECCHPYPSHYRTAFAFSHPPTRTALGWPCDLPTFLSEGAIRAYHVPQG